MMLARRVRVVAERRLEYSEEEAVMNSRALASRSTNCLSRCFPLDEVGSQPWDLNGLSTDLALRMARAAHEVVECHAVLATSQTTVVGALLSDYPEFTEWEHYPPDDVYDRQTHAQYYYHAHPPADRSWTEHGHFHIFLRAEGMPDDAEPVRIGVVDRTEPVEPLAHLIAISMDRFGLPIRLFTTNRWVTAETWYPAKDVIRMIKGFAVEHDRSLAIVDRWLTGMVRLFEPQIEVLLVERDRCVAAWEKANPHRAALEDRQLEVTSSVSISLELQIARLDEVLSSRGLTDEIEP